MEEIKLRRVLANATFAGSGKEYGLKVGQRYKIAIAYLVSYVGLQVALDDNNDALLVIDYQAQHDFDREWKDLKNLSKKRVSKQDNDNS